MMRSSTWALLWIKSTRASSASISWAHILISRLSFQSCWSLLMLLKTIGVAAKKWWRNCTDWLLLLLFRWIAGVCLRWNGGCRWLAMALASILTLGCGWSWRYILLVILLILWWLRLLDPLYLALVHHVVLIIGIVGRRLYHLRMLIWSLWWVDRPSILLLRRWWGSNCSWPTHVWTVWNIIVRDGYHLLHLMIMIILLILAHSIDLLLHLVAALAGLMMSGLVWWRRWHLRNLCKWYTTSS